MTLEQILAMIQNNKSSLNAGPPTPGGQMEPQGPIPGMKELQNLGDAWTGKGA